jgi:hypothetical protein
MHDPQANARRQPMGRHDAGPRWKRERIKAAAVTMTAPPSRSAVANAVAAALRLARVFAASVDG